MGRANVWPGSWALGAWGAVGSHAGCSVIVKRSGKHWRELRSWEENTEAESRSSFPDPSFGGLPCPKWAGCNGDCVPWVCHTHFHCVHCKFGEYHSTPVWV